MVSGPGSLTGKLPKLSHWPEKGNKLMGPGACGFHFSLTMRRIISNKVYADGGLERGAHVEKGEKFVDHS